MPGYHDIVPRNSAMVHPGFNDGIKRPGANNIMRLGPHTHGHKFARLFTKIIVATDKEFITNIRRNGGRIPGVHYISVRLNGAAFAVWAGAFIGRFLRIYWQLLGLRKDYLIA